MAELNSFMSEGLFGLTSQRSTRGRDKKLYPIQIYNLGTIQSKSQGTLTWQLLADYGITWGEPTTPIYTSPQPNYTYVWNLTSFTFTVNDGAGNITTHQNVKHLNDLRVSWGVFTSNQFFVQFYDETNGDVFLIGDRSKKLLPSIIEEIGEYMYNNYLESGNDYTGFDRLSDYIKKLENSSGAIVEDPTVIDMEVITNEFLSMILIDVMMVLPAFLLQCNNVYPVDLYNTDTGISGKIDDGDGKRTIRQGIFSQSMSLLMIALFAQRLLTADNKIVYEPWMLYSTFMWYVKSVPTSSNNRKIFDLSPRW